MIDKIKRNVLSSWFAVALWMVIIYFLSNQPSLSTGLGMWDLAGRKIAHMVEYATLVFLVWNALMNSFWEMSGPRYNRYLLMIAAIFSFLYAVGDEYHQTFIFGRVGTPNDVAIDSMGVIAMVLLINYGKIKNRFAGK